MKTLLNKKTFIIAMVLVIGIAFAGFAEEALYIDAYGNVGIGTTSPTETLHLFNSSAYQLRMSYSGVGTWDIGVYTGDKFAIREDGESPSLVIDNSGSVGIGTATPYSWAKLTVAGDTVVEHSGTPRLRINDTSGNESRLLISGSSGSWFWIDAPTSGYLRLSSGSSPGTNPMVLTYTGKVGIGTTNPYSKLHVNGGDIRVSGGSFIDDGTTLNVPDYVFEDEYDLMSLSELKNYINKENHLPNIPNSEKIKENGLNISEFQMKLLEKIEELTLYTLEQQKRIEDLEKGNNIQQQSFIDKIVGIFN